LRVERAIYRVAGIAADADQPWPAYLRSLLSFSAAGIGLLYLLLRLQDHLPYSLAHPGMPPALAFDTAVSFTTNTSWQSYAGESTLGQLALAAGLGTQAFLSAAVGIAAALALIRGLARRETDQVGNFWVDITRTCVRLVLPLALAGGVVLLALGVIQNWPSPQPLSTIAGGSQTILGGPVASREPIKLLTGDGGGPLTPNSAYPFENPTPVTNIIEIILMLLIPPASPVRMAAWWGTAAKGGRWRPS
jgi:K+-transporting ATPase ATPase A chain